MGKSGVVRTGIMFRINVGTTILTGGVAAVEVPALVALGPVHHGFLVDRFRGCHLLDVLIHAIHLPSLEYVTIILIF